MDTHTIIIISRVDPTFIIDSTIRSTIDLLLRKLFTQDESLNEYTYETLDKFIKHSFSLRSKTCVVIGL